MTSDQSPDLPCGHPQLLDVLKRSGACAAIRQLVVDGKVIDAWEIAGRHDFIFELWPDVGDAPGAPRSAALFEISQVQPDPHAAQLLTPAAEGAHLAVTHLQNPVVCCLIRSRNPQQRRRRAHSQITESDEDSAISW